MIFQFEDGREFDSENEQDVERLARSLLASEKALATLMLQFESLHKSFRAAMERQIVVPPTDVKPVVDALAQVDASVKRGTERIVVATLSDSVLVRDANGEPERAKREV